MQKGSFNYKEQLSKVQKIGLKTRNQRKDYINKEALRLSQENDAIAVEDIDLRGMAQCLKLGKKLHDNGFGQFRVVLENKLRDKGSILIKVGKYYPSTKKCHCCGFCNSDIKLEDRKWVCPNCGVMHDRDENAAINIREEGKRIFADYYQSVLKKEEQSEMRAKRRSEFRHRSRK